MSRVGGRRRLAERGRARPGVPSARRRGDVVCCGIRLHSFEFHQRLHRGGRPGPSGGRFHRASSRRPRLPAERQARTTATTGQGPFQRQARARKGSRDCTGCRGRRVRPPFGTILPRPDSSAPSGGLGAHDREIVRGPRIAGLGRFEVPAFRSRGIAGHANSLLVHRAKPILRRGKAERGGAFEPPGGRWLILRQSPALEQAHREFILRIGLAGGDGVAQTTRKSRAGSPP